MAVQHTALTILSTYTYYSLLMRECLKLRSLFFSFWHLLLCSAFSYFRWFILAWYLISSNGVFIYWIMFLSDFRIRQYFRWMSLHLQSHLVVFIILLFLFAVRQWIFLIWLLSAFLIHSSTDFRMSFGWSDMVLLGNFI